jgi:hypothetical protein
VKTFFSDLGLEQVETLTNFAEYDGNIYIKVGSTLFAINKDSGKTWNPLEGKLNSKKDGLKAKVTAVEEFQKISTFMIQENVLVT